MFELADKLTVICINALIVFVLATAARSSTRSNLTSWLLITTIVIAGWVNSAYLGFISTDTSRALTFYRLNGAFVSIFLFIEYMLYIDAFLQIRKNFFRLLFLITSLTWTYLILFTNEVVVAVTPHTWGNDIVFGRAYSMFTLFFMISNICFIAILCKKYFEFKDDKKRKVLFFLIGSFLFITANIIFNVIAPALTNTTKLQHFGDYSAIFLLFFTSIAIVKYNFLEIKNVFNKTLLGIVGISLTVDFLLLDKTQTAQNAKSIILISSIFVFAILLISIVFDIKEVTKVLKRLIAVTAEEFVYGAHLLSFGASCIVLSILLVFSLPIKPILLLIAYLISQIIYTYNHSSELSIDQKTNPERVSHITNTTLWVEFSHVFYFAALCICLLFTDWQLAFLAQAIVIGGVLYTDYFKKLPIVGFKSFYVAFFWATLTLLIPFYYGISTYLSPFLYIALFTFARWLVNTTFFDIKDIESDRELELKTIPVFLGKKPTVYLLQIINVLSGVPLIIGVLLGMLPKESLLLLPTLLFGAGYLTAGLYLNGKNLRLLSYTIVDGEYLLWPIILFLSKLFF